MSDLTTIERRVLDVIDIDEMLAFLCQLIAVRSLGGEETPAQEMVADLLGDSGLEVDIWPIDFGELSRHPAFCVEVERQNGLGVVGILGEPSNGPDLIFNGHTDVVPAGDAANWTLPPWQGTVSDGRLYGRGSADMKGGLCCAIFAARALSNAGIKLDSRLLIQSVIGEEDGGCGTLASLVRGHSANAAIVIEPTNMAVVPAQAGALNFRLTVSGLSAHGCLRDEGVSAIEKFYPLFDALRVLERRRNESDKLSHPLLRDYGIPYPISVGTINAGNWASTVPESLVCEGRFGVGVGEEVSGARASFEQAMAQAAATDPWLRQNPPKVEWWGGQFLPAETDPRHPIVGSLTQAHEIANGTVPPIQGVTYGADMRLLVNEGGIPTVLFGPGDVRRAHAPDEYVPVEDLVAVTRTLALTALRFCGHS